MTAQPTLTDAKLADEVRGYDGYRFPEVRQAAGDRIVSLATRIAELERVLLAQIEWASDITDEELRTAATGQASSLVTPSQARLVLDARAALLPPSQGEK